MRGSLHGRFFTGVTLVHISEFDALTGDPYQTLREAIHAMRGCDSRHVVSKLVREVFQGMLAWEGIVEEFDLIVHPKAKTCYAWSDRESARMDFVAGLALPPVDSPGNAVKIAIATEAVGWNQFSN